MAHNKTVIRSCQTWFHLDLDHFLARENDIEELLDRVEVVFAGGERSARAGDVAIVWGLQVVRPTRPVSILGVLENSCNV